MWITAAHLHFEENAAKWYQAYKQNHTFKNWDHFCSVVEKEFGYDDFRTAMNALLNLKQTGTVEDYTSQFQALQYDITMHNSNYDELFFMPQYIRGLKEEIRGTVEPQMLQTVQKMSTVARIQQGMIERNKTRYNRENNQIRHYAPPKADYKPLQQTSTLWKDRQLWDYRKVNGLCFYCGEKFVLGHIEVYSKR